MALPQSAQKQMPVRRVGAADDARRRHLRIAGAQMRLHGIERRLIDQRRHVDGDDLVGGLQHLVLGVLVELVVTNIGRPRQDAVDLPDAPAPAVAGEDRPMRGQGSGSM